MAHDPRKNAGRKIKFLREQAGDTPARLAHWLDVEPAELRTWERGEARPPDEALETIAETYDVSMDYFEDKPKPRDTFVEEEATAFGATPEFAKDRRWKEGDEPEEPPDEMARKLQELEEDGPDDGDDGPPALSDDADEAVEVGSRRPEASGGDETPVREGMVTDISEAISTPEEEKKEEEPPEPAPEPPAEPEAAPEVEAPAPSPERQEVLDGTEDYIRALLRVLIDDGYFGEDDLRSTLRKVRERDLP